MAESSSSGLLAVAKRLLSNMATLGEVRLNLLANDLQFEKLRVLDSLVWIGLALVGGAAGLGLVSAGLLMLLQPPQRGWAMLVLGSIYLFVAWFGLSLARQKLRDKPRPFSASLAELQRDKAALTGQPANFAAAEGGHRDTTVYSSANAGGANTRRANPSASQAAAAAAARSAAERAAAADAAAELSVAVAALRREALESEARSLARGPAADSSRRH